jgi:hypothetical protein
LFAEIQIESQIFQKALPFPLEEGEKTGEKRRQKSRRTRRDFNLDFRPAKRVSLPLFAKECGLVG